LLQILETQEFESAIFWGWVYEAQNRSVLDIHEGNWGKFVISPKPHEDSSIEATNKFVKEIELRKKSIIACYN
jgi:hypothetical protein